MLTRCTKLSGEKKHVFSLSFPTLQHPTLGDAATFSNYQMRVKIDEVFADGFVPQERVDNFISNMLSRCNNANIANFMRFAAKASRKQKTALLKDHLSNVASHLRTSPQKWSYIHIAYIIYGLQSMNENDKGLMDVFAVMTEAGVLALARKDAPTPQTISMLAYGLQNIDSNKDEIKRLLALITLMTRKCSDE